MPANTLRRILLFWAIGAVIAVAIALLASAMPSVFGWFTLPFWVLPALAGFGAHDGVILPFGLVSGSLFYGAVSFFILRFIGSSAAGPKI
jgi:hypothetical protein